MGGHSGRSSPSRPPSYRAATPSGVDGGAPQSFSVWGANRSGGGAGTGTGTGGSYPSFSTRTSAGGFLTRHIRRISNSLPRFSDPAAMIGGGRFGSSYADKEKLGRGRSYGRMGVVDRWCAAAASSSKRIPLVGCIRSLLGRMGRRLKIRLVIVLGFLMLVWIFFHTREFSRRCDQDGSWRRGRDEHMLTCKRVNLKPSISITKEHGTLAGARSSSSSWARTWAEASWSGRVRGNGPLSGTA